ncbi:MAG: phage holin family protein [Candidatus Bathyarchaeia archaeon]
MSEEQEKPSFGEKLLNAILRKTVGNLADSFDHYARKFVRAAAMILAGISIALLGITVIAIGVVKWFALFLPSWLAWTIVGITLLLIGTVLVAANK